MHFEKRNYPCRGDHWSPVLSVTLALKMRASIARPYRIKSVSAQLEVVAW